MITFNTLIGFMINVDRRQKGKCEKHDNTTDVCKTHLLQPVVVFCYLVFFLTVGTLPQVNTSSRNLFSLLQVCKVNKSCEAAGRDLLSTNCHIQLMSFVSRQYFTNQNYLLQAILYATYKWPCHMRKNKSSEDILFISVKLLGLQKKCQVFS